MAIEFFSSVDLNENELQFPVIHPLGSAPSTGTEGQLYYDTGDNVVYVNTSTNANSPTWVSMGGDINGVTAGNGLSGGGSSGAVTLTLDISDSSLTTGTSIADADLLAYSDEDVSSPVADPTKNITFANFYGSIFGKVSSHVAIASNGAATIQDGVVTNAMLAGSIANGNLSNSSITVADDASPANTSNISLGGTLTFAAGEGIDVAESSGTVTYSAEDATVSNKGVASFASADFSVSSGAVTIKSSGVSNTQLAGSIANAKLANDSIQIGTTEIELGNASATIAGLTGLDMTAADHTIFATVGSNTLTIGHADSTITIAGNLKVTGDTTYHNETIQVVANNTIQFEGTTADANEVLLTAADATGSDKTITLPNLSGHVALLTTAAGATIDATPAELNIMDGNTSATSTTIAAADRVVVNDAGTMKQVAVTDLAAYYDDAITAMPNLTSVGTLTALNVDNININGNTISSSDTNGDITITPDGTGEVNIAAGDLNYAGTAITATGAELNIMDGGTTATSTTIVDADRVVVNDNGTMKQVAVSQMSTYYQAEHAAARTIKTTITATGGSGVNDATNKRATIQHDLGTYDVMVEMYLNTDATFRSTVHAEVTRTSNGSTQSANHITIDFGNDIPADIIVLITDCSGATEKSASYS